MTDEDNNFNQQSEADFVKEIEESIKETENNQLTFNRYRNSNKTEGFTVKGDCCMDKQEYGVEDFPKSKENVAIHLALALDDEENLAWYESLVKKHRIDLLKNCLRVTLQDYKNGKIKKTISVYFTGVVKNKISQNERIEKYKREHYKHTTLVVYKKEKYEK